MGKFRLGISMSLDGFVAGPNPSVENPLGVGGEQLHEWAYGLEAFRRPHGMQGGGVNASHQREPLVKQGGTTFTFVTDGIESALAQARAAAGERDVSLGGGADVAQQYLAAGLLDEVLIQLVPVLLHGGVPLFRHLDGAEVTLEQVEAIAAPGVTHVRYRPRRGEQRAGAERSD